jgi:hypothetical protein
MQGPWEERQPLAAFVVGLQSLSSPMDSSLIFSGWWGCRGRRHDNWVPFGGPVTWQIRGSSGETPSCICYSPSALSLKSNVAYFEVVFLECLQWQQLNFPSSSYFCVEEGSEALVRRRARIQTLSEWFFPWKSPILFSVPVSSSEQSFLYQTGQPRSLYPLILPENFSV